MIALNFTLFVQLGLFLVFLWVTNKVIYRPLLRTMDARTDKTQEDRATAESQTKDAQQLEALHKDRLVNAHQDAARRHQKARYEAYLKNREALGVLRSQSEQELVVYRAGVEAQLAEERRKLPGLLPPIVEAIDRQVNTEGSLL